MTLSLISFQLQNVAWVSAEEFFQFKVFLITGQKAQNALLSLIDNIQHVSAERANSFKFNYISWFCYPKYFYWCVQFQWKYPLYSLKWHVTHPKLACTLFEFMAPELYCKTRPRLLCVCTVWQGFVSCVCELPRERNVLAFMNVKFVGTLYRVFLCHHRTVCCRVDNIVAA